MKKNLFIVPVLLFYFFLATASIAGAAENPGEAGKTPKESEIIDNLRLGLVVFLCFHSPEEPGLDKIKADIGAVEANFRGAVASVYVSGDDKNEAGLRENFRITPDDTAVFIVLPTGAAVAKLEGSDITKSNLMRELYSSCGGGGCGSGCGSGCG